MSKDNENTNIDEEEFKLNPEEKAFLETFQQFVEAADINLKNISKEIDASVNQAKIVSDLLDKKITEIAKKVEELEQRIIKLEGLRFE